MNGAPGHPGATVREEQVLACPSPGAVAEPSQASSMPFRAAGRSAVAEAACCASACAGAAGMATPPGAKSGTSPADVDCGSAPTEAAGADGRVPRRRADGERAAPPAARPASYAPGPLAGFRAAAEGSLGQQQHRHQPGRAVGGSVHRGPVTGPCGVAAGTAVSAAPCASAGSERSESRDPYGRGSVAGSGTALRTTPCVTQPADQPPDAAGQMPLRPSPGGLAVAGPTMARRAAAGLGPGVREPLRFVALGDSLTAGLGDPVPSGEWRGWAALLAPALAAEPNGARLLNCSRSGALTIDVAGEQLAEALSHRPHLASVVVGANDTLRGSFDIEVVAHRLDAVFGALRAQGAGLLTACLPDPGRMLGLPWPLARPLGRRMRALNHVVHALSDHYGAVHLHTAHHAWVLDRASWSADKLHPSELGHRLLAREFHTLLTAAGLASGEPPSVVPDGPGPGRAASAYWMATRGTKWVWDRCSDLLPDLLRLAVAECRHQASGTGTALELNAHRATVRAIASLNLSTYEPLEAA